MTPFFSTPESVKALDLEARGWEGTPFAPHAIVKHGGVDCVGLVAGIYLALGVIKKFEPGKYTLDEGQHGEESKVLKWFAGQPEFVRAILPLADGHLAPLAPWVQPGDVICMKFANVEHHVGLMLDKGDFIHAVPSRRAQVSNLRESYYSDRITALFRPQKL